MNRDPERCRMYDRARPSYSVSAVPEIQSYVGAPVVKDVADIGSGTGISSRYARQFAEHVFAVEPDADMRAVAASRDDDGVTLVAGSAEATSLPDGGVDLVVIGGGLQAYSTAAARREVVRVGRDGARIVVLWCHLATSDARAEGFVRFWRRHVGPALIEPFQLNALTERFLETPQVLYRGIDVHLFDADRLEQIVVSSSAGPNPAAVGRRRALRADALRLADVCGGALAVPFETVCYGAKLS